MCSTVKGRRDPGCCRWVCIAAWPADQDASPPSGDSSIIPWHMTESGSADASTWHDTGVPGSPFLPITTINLPDTGCRNRPRDIVRSGTACQEKVSWQLALATTGFPVNSNRTWLMQRSGGRSVMTVTACPTGAQGPFAGWDISLKTRPVREPGRCGSFRFRLAFNSTGGHPHLAG